jgi:hypothetical protein
MEMDRKTALQLALRCASDSIRLEILLDVAANPYSRPVDVSRNIFGLHFRRRSSTARPTS